MPEVSPSVRPSATFPWTTFLRASTLHIGAAAAAVSLRRDLVEVRELPTALFDQQFAIARVTPGTNLLALYVLLGRHFAGWRGALQALTVATVPPSVIACSVAAIYGSYSSSPFASQAMRGARAGAMGVLLWAAVRLIRPQIEHRPVAGGVLGGAALVVALGSPIPPLALLLVGGAIGAVILKERA